jgi:hypothetical protein
MTMTMKTITYTRTAPQAPQIDYDADIFVPATKRGKGFGIHVLLLAAALPLILSADVVRSAASEGSSMTERCTAYMVKRHGSYYSSEDRRALTAQIRVLNMAVAAR